MRSVMTNIISSKTPMKYDGSTVSFYLDAAAELSKLERKNQHQVTEKGVPLVYDMTIEMWTPTLNNSNVPFVEGSVLTAPDHWVTRNAVRMAHFTREELREEAGVEKGSIGRYAKNMRLNLDSNMFGVTYDSTTASSGSTRRLYCQNAEGNDVDGGTWDYTQLSQVDPGDTNVGDPFYLNVCGSHSAAAPGPYTYIGVNRGYIERRQTVLEDATLTSGGSTDNVVTGSPFFRIPEQDESEDVYQAIVYDEQDNPPYDRVLDTGAIDDSADVAPIWIDQFQLGQTGSLGYHSIRVQAPLGLALIKLIPATITNGGGASIAFDFFWKITCHGHYEM